MPSFTATVLREKYRHGNKYLTLNDIVDKKPVDLDVTKATLEGTDEVIDPQGTIAPPDVVASFPYATVEAFQVQSRVRVSWTNEDGGELLGLALVAG